MKPVYKVQHRIIQGVPVGGEFARLKDAKVDAEIIAGCCGFSSISIRRYKGHEYTGCFIYDNGGWSRLK